MVVIQMKKILIENTKGIRRLEFAFPEATGVYLLAGANGVGKTTLLICMERICNSLAFARGFSTARYLNAVDQFENASILYETSDMRIRFRKKTARWAPTPRTGSSSLLQSFGYSDVIFVRADSKRIDISQDDLRAGCFVAADSEIKDTLNALMETQKYSRLMRLRNTNGRGRQASYYYTIREADRMYYSEKRFSTGELALLRLVEQLKNINENSLVLLDEAEMALHPRVQVNLIRYLVAKAREKNITIFVSTHSPAIIKAMDKEHIIMLNDSGNGNIEVISPCYPAKAIGCVDFESSNIFDYVFFVEDDMARTILKHLLNRYVALVPSHETALTSIIPVGGYEQTATMAVQTNRQLLSQSKVYAIVDGDAFDNLDANPNFRELYENHKDIIYGFKFTPEVWLIGKMEHPTESLKRSIQGKFHAEINQIVQSQEYRDCTASAPRKLAKKQWDVVVKKLCETSGDSDILVTDSLISTIVHDIGESEVRSVLGPILRR